jgi:hypothetical protein
MEWVVEWPLLYERWKIILFGLIFQVRSRTIFNVCVQITIQDACVCVTQNVLLLSEAALHSVHLISRASLSRAAY